MTTLRTFHFDFHPNHQAVTVVMMIARSLHQFEFGFKLKLLLTWWINMKRSQTNRTLRTLNSFLNIELFFKFVIKNGLK